MKLIDALLFEGGNAVKSSSRINQENVASTYSDIVKRLLKKINLKERDVSMLGSTGKKRPGGSSGDMDLAIDTNVLIKNNKLKDVRDVLTFLEKHTKSLSKEVTVNFGTKVVSLAWPISNVDGKQQDEFVQLDLMLAGNLEFSKFAYHSAHEDNTKYKGVYRTKLLMMIAQNNNVRVLK